MFSSLVDVAYVPTGTYITYQSPQQSGIDEDFFRHRGHDCDNVMTSSLSTMSLHLYTMTIANTTSHLINSRSRSPQRLNRLLNTNNLRRQLRNHTLQNRSIDPRRIRRSFNGVVRDDIPRSFVSKTSNQTIKATTEFPRSNKITYTL